MAMPRVAKAMESVVVKVMRSWKNATMSTAVMMG